MSDIADTAHEEAGGIGKLLPAIGGLTGAAVGAYTKWEMGKMAALTGAALYGGIGLLGGVALSYLPKLMSGGEEKHEEAPAEGH